MSHNLQINFKSWTIIYQLLPTFADPGWRLRRKTNLVQNVFNAISISIPNCQRNLSYHIKTWNSAYRSICKEKKRSYAEKVTSTILIKYLIKWSIIDVLLVNNTFLKNSNYIYLRSKNSAIHNVYWRLNIIEENKPIKRSF